jgi:large subunit ribosomal protein L22
MKKEIVSFAKLKNISVSPTKVRLVANAIRDKKIADAMAFLENTQRASNPYLLQLVKSAVANALQKKVGIDVDKLFVREIKVDKGLVLKRLRPRAMGRGSLIRKRSSHVFIGLSY